VYSEWLSLGTGMPEDAHKITDLLIAWRSGSPQAGSELMTLVYGELHELAARYMHRERVGHTLQTTALDHEVYIRLCGGEAIEWHDRAHFFAVAAQQVRRVLVDYARGVHAEKRGGGAVRVSLADADAGEMDRDLRLVALDQALQRLEEMDPRAAKVVELRYFGGLSEREAAETLGVSTATLKRDWEFARTWLVSQPQ
jgi:RNA polymerase sigma factor (TIGR02999 family)